MAATHGGVSYMLANWYGVQPCLLTTCSAGSPRMHSCVQVMWPKPSLALRWTGQLPSLSGHFRLLLWNNHNFVVVVDCFYIYSTILCSPADSLCLHVILHEWLAFYSMLLNIHRSGVRTYSADMAGATWNCCLLSEFCAHHAPCHFTQSHIYM